MSIQRFNLVKSENVHEISTVTATGKLKLSRKVSTIVALSSDHLTRDWLYYLQNVAPGEHGIRNRRHRAEWGYTIGTNHQQFIVTRSIYYDVTAVILAVLILTYFIVIWGRVRNCFISG